MSIQLNEDALHRAFDLPKLSYEEYRNQEVIETGDGGFFDVMDEAFGIRPRTDELVDALAG